MQLIEMIVLAVIQGIAEFLPISSSGHLAIVGAMLGQPKESAAVEIILHGGTLGSILVVYWRRILALLISDRRVIPMLVIGTIPVVLVGLPVKAFAEPILKNTLLAGCMLLVTSSVLVMLKYVPGGGLQYARMRWWQALVIGCFQAVAILPGISRSGSTIFGGRLIGLRGPDAVTFSFLLAIPAILGATVLEVKDLVEEGISGEEVTLLAIGALISFALGIFALRWLMYWSDRDRLHWFALWCGPLGLLVIGLHFAGML